MGVIYVPVQINLIVTLETALHIGTGLGLGQILDDLTVQGPHPDVRGSDLPYIPGSSLKGRLRYHTRQLSATLFGDITQRSTIEAHLFGFDNRPGGLIYADAHLTPLGVAQELASNVDLPPLFARSERSFVSLSRQRRVALEERLFRIELAEHGLMFETAIVGNLPQESGKRDLGMLLAAISDVTHLGGHKSRGLGKCQITIKQVTLDTRSFDWHTLVENL